ncbi:MAG: hypothetical protein FJ102_21280 [Deltaproteobacteria bacterium]|nr:hypothetical protein [Deltaproteobacteria bacterium]
MGDPSVRSACLRCAAWKELPLGRCSACGHVPRASEAPLALLASTRMLSETDLAEVQRRLAQGTALQPSAARLAAARAILRGDNDTSSLRRLSPRELGLLALGTLLLTPLLPLAFAFTYRDAPAGRQALALGAAGLVADALLFAWSLF